MFWLLFLASWKVFRKILFRKSDKQVICKPPPLLPTFLWGVSLDTSSLKCIVTRPTPSPHPGGGYQPIRGPGHGWGPIRGRQGVRGPQTGNGWSLCYWVGNRENIRNFILKYFSKLFHQKYYWRKQQKRLYKYICTKYEKGFIWKQYLGLVVNVWLTPLHSALCRDSWGDNVQLWQWHEISRLGNVKIC